MIPRSLRHILRTDEWQKLAVCASTDPEAFFGDKGAQYAEARRVCLSCPVRLECINFAVRNHEEFGLWAGFTATQLRILIRVGGPFSSIEQAESLLDSAPASTTVATRTSIVEFTP